MSEKYEQRLNDLIRKKKLKREELIRLLNEFKVEQSQQQVDNLLSKGKLPRQELLNLFIKKDPPKSPFLTGLKALSGLKLTRLFIFKLGIFLVFIVAFLMAIFNVYQTLLKSNDHYHAVAGSISLVGFNLICFESFLFITLSKKIKWFVKIILSGIFLSLFLFLTTLILSSITVAQFDRYQKTIFENKIEQGDNLVDLRQDLEKEERELETEMNFRIDNRRELEIQLKLLEPNARAYNNTNWNIRSLNNEIKNYQSKLETLRMKKRELLSDKTIVTSVKRTTLFEFLNEKVFIGKVNSTFLEFFQIIAPSLIYDLISSISLGLIFFMKEEI